ncbi:MAG: hypothetical protein H0T57_08435 [Rubrobacter sp.]|nr:hypothetical protein [Rubrobacter sp.]
MYDEIAVLSKKSPNDAMNRFKLRFTNSLLRQGNELLGERYIPFDNFSEFDEDDVPQNSDIVFILAQYLQCFEKLRADNVIQRYTDWYWALEASEGEEGDESGRVYVDTVKPKRLRE